MEKDSQELHSAFSVDTAGDPPHTYSQANDHQSNKENETNFVKKNKSVEWFAESEE